MGKIEINSSADLSRGEAMYAPEFGLLQTLHQITATGTGSITLTIPLA